MDSVIGKLTSFAASAECITKSLEEGKTSDDIIIKNSSSVNEVLKSQWMANFWKTNENSSNSQNNFQLKFFSSQLEEVVVGLWNATVTRQTTKSIQDKTIATLRQLCYDLLSSPLCANVRPTDPRHSTYLHRRVMMATKAGKGWMDIGNYECAEAILLRAKEDSEKLQALFKSSNNEEPVETQEMVLLNKNVILVLCHLAEIAYETKTFAVSFEHINIASEMECLQAEDKEPDEYKRERDRISALAYNFGLNASIKHKHDDSIKWLSFSYEFSKKRKAADLKLMAQTLRLLAHVYCETGVPENMAKALGTLEIANNYFCHPAGFHLRLKVMSKDNAAKDDQLKSALLELLRHKELTIDLGLSACRFLNTYKRYEACELGLKELLSRFTGSRHVGRVHAQRHQAAIERLPVQDALDFSDKFLDDQEVLTSFDDESCKVIQLSLWEQAAKCHDAGEMDHCMRWYDQSLRLFLYGKSLDEVKSDRQACDNVAKLQRNRASCLLSFARFAEAEEAARAAVEFDNDSLLSSFTLFKVAIAKCDENEAVEAVKNLTSKKDMDCSTAPFSGKKVSTRHALICLAAQLALERSQRQVAMVTLRYLATTGDQNYSKLVAYRCLIRLYLTMAEEVEGDETTSSFVNAIDGKTTNADPAAHSNEVEPMETESENINWKSRFCLMTAAIKSAFESYEVLKHIKLSLKPNDAHQLDKGLVLPGNENHVINDEEYDKEVTWFMKIAWNMALQFNQNPVTMKRLFMLCQDLLNLSESNEGVLLRQKTCLLMCAACGLAIARNAASFDDSRTELNAVLDITARCQKVCDKLAGLDEAQTPQKEDKSSVLLALYRFEALAKLTKPNQTGVSEKVNFYFDEITRFRLADFKTYETLAALSIEPPARHSDVCKKALKMALKEINRKLAQESNNADKTPLLKKKSSLYRKLIDVALGEGSSSDPSSKEEAWMYFNEVLQAMQSDVWKYPDMDALWTTIRCWNTGIHLFVADHVIEAEKWCALALRMLAQVERFKGSYENHMNIVYQEILSKKDYAVVRQPSSNFAL